MRRTKPVLSLIAAAAMLPALFLTAAAKDDTRSGTLRAAELARFQANDAADAKVLGELLDDELEYVHSNGELDSKKSFIDSLTSGKRDYVSSTPTIETIRFLDDVAIIRGKVRVTVADAGTSRDLHIGYTDVWVFKNGKWRMTAWRSARLPDSPVK
jgi:hypothetical protein